MKKLLFLILTFIFLNNFTFAQATTSLEKLWYYKEESGSRNRFLEIAEMQTTTRSLIDVLAPQTYFLNYNGEVKGEVKADILQKAKEKKMKIIPLLANITFYKDKNGNKQEYFNQKIIHDLLDKKENWGKVSSFMIDEAKKNNYIGWQLDLENINVSRKDNFLEFTKFLKAEFSKNNLIISAAIVSKTSDNQKDYEKNYWNNWAGVYDYKKLGEILDFVSVMAYDEPSNNGPVASITWSKKVLDYSLKNISAEKVSFGIPVYAWAYRSNDWKAGKKHFAMVNFDLVKKYLEQASPQPSPKEKEQNISEKSKDKLTGKGRSKIYGNIPWISYDRNGVNYTLWYEDKMSFETKLQNLSSCGKFLQKTLSQDSACKIRGFSVWVLGDEDKKIWELF
jgi:spore germination protein YaaH